MRDEAGKVTVESVSMLCSKKSSKWSVCMAMGLVINTSLQIYSHIKINAVVFSSIEPVENLSPDLQLRDMCLSDSDKINWYGPGEFNASANCELWNLYDDAAKEGFNVYPRSCPYVNATSAQVAFNDFMFIYGLECGLGAEECLANRVALDWKFSTNCTKCFSGMFSCTTSMCALECIGSLRKQGCPEDKCASCVADKCSKSSPLDESFDFSHCSGLEQIPYTEYIYNGCISKAGPPSLSPTIESNYQCTIVEDSNITMYNAFDITFGNAVVESWKSGAYGLSLLIAVASGAWPYIKSILMFVCWFLPISFHTRMTILKWIGLLGKWSFVDVFSVIVLIAGVRIDKSISGEILVVRAESSYAIYAFAIAAVMALVQAEWIERIANEMVEDHVPKLINRTNFRLRVIIVSFSGLGLGLIVSGLAITAIEFVMEGVLAGFPGPGSFSYTGGGVAFSLVSECALPGNGSIAGTYFLIVVFVLMVIVFPILALVGYIVTAVASNKIEPRKFVLLATNVTVFSRFAAMDVYLVSLLVMIAQFEKIIDGTIQSQAPDICPGTSKPQECLSFYGVLTTGSFLLTGGVVCFWIAQMGISIFIREQK